MIRVLGNRICSCINPSSLEPWVFHFGLFLQPSVKAWASLTTGEVNFWNKGLYYCFAFSWPLCEFWLVHPMGCAVYCHSASPFSYFFIEVSPGTLSVVSITVLALLDVFPRPASRRLCPPPSPRGGLEAFLPASSDLSGVVVSRGSMTFKICLYPMPTLNGNNSGK